MKHFRLFLSIHPLSVPTYPVQGHGGGLEPGMQCEMLFFVSPIAVLKQK